MLPPIYKPSWHYTLCQERMSRRGRRRSIQLHKNICTQISLSRVKWFDHIWSIAVSNHFQIIWSLAIRNSTTDVSRTVPKLDAPSAAHALLIMFITIKVPCTCTYSSNPFPVDSTADMWSTTTSPTTLRTMYTESAEQAEQGESLYCLLRFQERLMRAKAVKE